MARIIFPRAFNEKVQESLQEIHNGTIPFEELTYGDLISEVKKEGLKLCSQLKLQYQVKKDQKASRKDLGSFCAHYGIEMPIPPSQILKKIQMRTRLLLVGQMCDGKKVDWNTSKKIFIYKSHN